MTTSTGRPAAPDDDTGSATTPGEAPSALTGSAASRLGDQLRAESDSGAALAELEGLAQRERPAPAV